MDCARLVHGEIVELSTRDTNLIASRMNCARLIQGIKHVNLESSKHIYLT